MTTSAKNTSSSNKPKAAYLVQREARKRFSFGNAWKNAVLDGRVNDKDKLVAHALKLKVAGSKSKLRQLRMETLLSKVQSALTETPTKH